MDFAVPVDHREKIKESKTRDKYLDHARELRKVWNMKVAVIPIVIGALGMVPKGLERRLGEFEIRGLQRCWDPRKSILSYSNDTLTDNSSCMYAYMYAGMYWSIHVILFICLYQVIQSTLLHTICMYVCMYFS